MQEIILEFLKANPIVSPFVTLVLGLGGGYLSLLKMKQSDKKEYRDDVKQASELLKQLQDQHTNAMGDYRALSEDRDKLHRELLTVHSENKRLSDTVDKLRIQVDKLEEQINQYVLNEVSFWRKIMQFGPIATCRLNIDSEIYDVNVTFEDRTTWSAGELHGHKLSELIHPEDHAANAKMLNEIMQGNRLAYKIVSRIRTRNGEYRCFDCCYVAWLGINGVDWLTAYLIPLEDC